MAATLVALADEIARLLNTVQPALTGALYFQARRDYLPQFTREQLAELRVTVVPLAKRGERATRGHLIQEDPEFAVGFMRHVPNWTKEDIDTLVLTLQEAADYLVKTATADPVAHVLTWEEVPFDRDSLETHSQFIAELRVKYRLWRTPA